MITRRRAWQMLSSLPLIAGIAARVSAQAAQAPPAASSSGGPGTEMLTIFLHHDQAKTLEEINEHLKTKGWFKDFRPAGVEVVTGPNN
jgi:hypothetical protein